MFDDDDDDVMPLARHSLLHREYAEAVGEKAAWRVVTKMLDRFADAVGRVVVETDSDEARAGAEVMRAEIIRTARAMAGRFREEQGLGED